MSFERLISSKSTNSNNTRSDSTDFDCDVHCKNYLKNYEIWIEEICSKYKPDWDGVLENLPNFMLKSETNQNKTVVDNLLHFAAKTKQVKTIEFLLGKGSKNPPILPKVDLLARNEQGNYYLHSALIINCTCSDCTRKTHQCIDLLFKFPVPICEFSNCTEKSHRCDESQSTKHKHPDCLRAHSEPCNQVEYYFKRALYFMRASKCSENTMLYFMQKSWDKMTFKSLIDGTFPLCNVLKMTPGYTDEVIKYFDSYIKNEEHMDGSEKKIVLDFKPVLPAQNTSEESIEKIRMNPSKEIEFVYNLVNTNSSISEAILRQPLVATFVYLKWQRFMKFAGFSIIYYLFLAFCISSYVLNVHITKCPHTWLKKSEAMVMNNSGTIRLNNQTEEEIIFESKKESRAHVIDNLAVLIRTPKFAPRGSDGKDCKYGFQTTFYQVTILIMLFFIFIKEVLKLFSKSFRKEYIRNWRNSMDFVLIFTATLMLKTHFIGLIQYRAASFGVFMIWALLLLQIGKFPKLSIFIEMFNEVLKTLGFFLLTFGVIFIGFALSACVLFSNTNSHYTVPRSLLKVFAMAAGEYGYEDVLYKGEKEESLRYPYLAHLFYLCFIFVASLSLMNLLIGLAVGNVEEGKTIAEVVSLAKIIKHIAHIEEFVFSKMLPSCIGSSLQKFIILKRDKDRNIESGGWFFRIFNRLRTRKQDSLVQNQDEEKRLKKDTTKLLHRYTFKFLPYDPKGIAEFLPKKIKHELVNLANINEAK